MLTQFPLVVLHSYQLIHIADLVWAAAAGTGSVASRIYEHTRYSEKNTNTKLFGTVYQTTLAQLVYLGANRLYQFPLVYLYSYQLINKTVLLRAVAPGTRAPWRTWMYTTDCHVPHSTCRRLQRYPGGTHAIRAEWWDLLRPWSTTVKQIGKSTYVVLRTASVLTQQIEGVWHFSIITFVIVKRPVTLRTYEHTRYREKHQYIVYLQILYCNLCLYVLIGYISCIQLTCILISC